jgi:hypothetical protein
MVKNILQGVENKLKLFYALISKAKPDLQRAIIEKVLKHRTEFLQELQQSYASTFSTLCSADILEGIVPKLQDG